MWLRLAIAVSAYLLGSIPFSYLVVRLTRRADIREHGSGNVGATNVLRNFGKLAGLSALLLDAGKGWAAVALAHRIIALPQWGGAGSPVDLVQPLSPLDSPSYWIGLAALLAVLGHIFPFWLGFRGGKGVATAAGVFLALDPHAIAGALIIFALVLLLTRYVSLASMLSAASMPLFLRFMVGESFWIIVFSVLISLTIVVRHRGNIHRLAHGTERKLGQRRDDA
ncbi:MAG TPA: glycerol-3-phosphate 1-O-acyltransferase PlsY [Thermoanaerobaculia bacterium]|nr:glycerol-3-phosphate 1-O-acyltransferase PlsY [Thermoanaerobaculia bacterium]